jgi:hypothetical protein
MDQDEKKIEERKIRALEENTREILDLKLTLAHFSKLMFRMNVMGIPIHGQPGKYRPAAEKGIADIYVQLMVMGIPVSCWLEVKAKKGRQQASQKEFEQRVENYYVVRSVDDAAAAIDDVRKKTTDKFAVFSTALNSLKEDQ